ncbi:MAG: hypothetical protein L3K16_06075 [Thermoplasmata archaeon]|nr:hypothetical protein [Thermoplasmata archaeon]
MSTPAPPRRPVGIGIAIIAVFAVVAALLFTAVYLTQPGNSHFYGLITIGILSLVFALAAYLAQAAAPDPTAPRALSWGFAGLGFALLVGTVVFAPSNPLNPIAQLIVLIVILLFLGATLLGAYWRVGTVATARARLERRDQWKAQPPRSALDYAAAQHDPEVTQSPPSTPKGSP